MSNIFLCSDHHYNHAAILTFVNSDGSQVRKFSCVEEMNAAIIDRHNSVVQTTDKVYFLGDLTMGSNAKALEFLGRMNGKKVLIKGNHDLNTASQYLKYFKDIRGSHQLDRYILTHVPIHSDSLSRWTANIHGHLHCNQVQLNGKVDPRYFNVSMERINFTPIALEDVVLQIKNRLEA